MTPHRYQFVEQWDEASLSILPVGETDIYEYKSSLTSDKNLGDKIAVAASAFLNSGGGIFVAGVDKSGKIDGGITDLVGRQPRRDWVDQHLARVAPVPQSGFYSVNPIPSPTTSTSSLIKPNHCVLVIGFGESPNAPHMAPDNKYYVRAGAHSYSIGHFLVEAISARKAVQVPMIRAILERSKTKNAVINLVIQTANDSTALNVELTFDPLPKMFADHIPQSFPLRIPVINKQHPFSIELFRMLLKSEMFGVTSVNLVVEYDDVMGNRHKYEQIIDPERNRVPLSTGDDTLADIEQAIMKLVKQFETLNKTAK